MSRGIKCGWVYYEVDFHVWAVDWRGVNVCIKSRELGSAVLVFWAFFRVPNRVLCSGISTGYLFLSIGEVFGNSTPTAEPPATTTTL
ncbi:hypothetical protein CHS0354_035635 [Potamilus streckersoni]|uniref:Uncharacterized protein n=1 Tax=Potamilus streckersoni TaxID=2493646 RepID=A0AAE0RQ97_9BIVA|nr:hypothetical protein CHS0354_035635 [Potamilus streckersoni]